MNVKRTMATVAALCALSGSAMAYSISFAVEASNGIFLNDGTTLLPSGAFFQVWWSPDANWGDLNGGVGNGELDLTTASMTDPSGPSAYGDYVIFSGTLPSDGFWGEDNTATYANSDVGGATVSSGFVYVYVYQDGTPDVGDSYVRSPIYGPGNGSLGVANAWGNPASVPPPPADLVEVAPEAQLLGTHFVVPEPGTMALFGLGLLTVAARRRRK